MHKNIIFSHLKGIKLFAVLVDMVQLLEVDMILVSEITVRIKHHAYLNFQKIIPHLEIISTNQIFDLLVVSLEIFKLSNGRFFI